MKLSEEDIFQKVADKKITMEQALALLEHLNASTADEDQAAAEEARPTAAQIPTEPSASAAGAPRDLAGVTAMLSGFLSELLKIEAQEIKPGKDLMDYGFDSLTGQKLANRIRETLGYQLPARTFYEHHTLKALSRFIHRESSPSGEESSQEEEEAEAPEQFPLAEGQRALWFIHQMDPDNYAYNLPSATLIRTEVDVEKMKLAYQIIIERQRVLSITFKVVDDTPFQVVLPRREIFFEHEDLSHLDLAAIEAYAQEIAHRPFDLENDALIRVYLLTRAKKEHVLLLVIHHIVFDGTSYSILINEISHVYECLLNDRPSQLPRLETQYTDFVQWQHAMLESERGASQWEYWRQNLAGELPLLELPTDFPRATARKNVGEVHAVEIDPARVILLKKLARSQRASLYMVLLSAFQVLLHRYTKQRDIIVGTPQAGRPESRFEPLMGYFMNMVSIRGSLSGGFTFSDFLGQLQNTVLDALDNADFPFSLLVKRLEIEPNTDRTPVFQAVFILQNWIQGLNQSMTGSTETEQAASKTIESVHETGGFDLTLEIMDYPDHAMGYFKYNPDLFSEARIHRMADHFQTLLSGILANPDAKISNLNILTAEEIHQLTKGFNNTNAAYDHLKTIHQLFEERVAARPDASAVIMGVESRPELPTAAAFASAAAEEPTRTLSYAELDARANQLAHMLRSYGVGAEVLVAICMNRSLELAVALLGVLKAGGGYVPMDPAYPKERIAFILEDTGAAVLLTQDDLLEKLPEHGARQVCLDASLSVLSGRSITRPAAVATPENLAYVIYTSGSTGKPKGVLIPHWALVNYSSGFVKHYRVEPVDRVLQFASISFDTAAEELYPSWISGAAVVLRPSEVTNSILGFLRFLDKEGITILDLPTAYWHEWVSEQEHSDLEMPSSLRLVIVGGEAASADRLKVWERHIGNRVLWSNTYGPTEATIAATLFEPTLS